MAGCCCSGSPALLLPTAPLLCHRGLPRPSALQRHREPASAAPFRQRVVTGSSPPSSSGSSGTGEAGNGNGGDGTTPQGNLEVQDALADILDMEIRKSKVKQDIMDDLEVRKEKLRMIGAELTEDFGKEIELDKMRMELASNMSLAETMDKFQQLEDEVQAVRDRLKSDKQELASWEERTTSAKNRGLFFGKLYKSSDKKMEEGDKEATARILEDIGQPATDEVRSPWRLYAFTYLGSISIAVLVADLLGGSPSYDMDALHAFIASLMAYQVWGERRALEEAAAARKQDV